MRCRVSHSPRQASNRSTRPAREHTTRGPDAPQLVPALLSSWSGRAVTPSAFVPLPGGGEQVRVTQAGKAWTSRRCPGGLGNALCHDATKIVAAVLLFALFASCVTAEGSFKKDGLPRAAFDLGCSADQLTGLILKRNDGLGCANSVVGVSGCGKQATYVCDVHQNWIKNSETTGLPAGK